MVAGAVLDYVFYSKDSGKTWKADKMESPLGVYGDPCIISDEDGNFYYFHLSNPSGNGWADDDILDRIVCQKSTNHGKSWSDGVGIGLAHPKDQDKEWAVYNSVNDEIMVTWTEFDDYGNKDTACHSRIMFAGSSSGGEKFSNSFQFARVEGNCIDDSRTVEGAVPAFDHEGNYYTVFAYDGKLWFYYFPIINSFHKGFSWGGIDSSSIPEFRSDSLGGKWFGADLGDSSGVPAREAIPITDSAAWSFDIPGIGRANGMPITVCDRSGGTFGGTIYVNWSDQRRGEEDTDIWLMKSRDKGKTWSNPIRVNNDPPGKHQFFTWMDVDESTGFIYIVFYDRRNHDDTKTDVYLAVSKDGGESFENIRISESPFLPSANVFFGDYNNISAVNGIIRPVWTRNDEGKLSIWTALVNEKNN